MIAENWQAPAHEGDEGSWVHMGPDAYHPKVSVPQKTQHFVLQLGHGVMRNWATVPTRPCTEGRYNG